MEKKGNNNTSVFSALPKIRIWEVNSGSDFRGIGNYSMYFPKLKSDKICLEKPKLTLHSD